MVTNIWNSFFNLLGFFRNPSFCSKSDLKNSTFERTVEMMMILRSWPWNSSVDATVTSFQLGNHGKLNFEDFLYSKDSHLNLVFWKTWFNRSLIFETLRLYGVITPMSLPRICKRCKCTNTSIPYLSLKSFILTFLVSNNFRTYSTVSTTSWTLKKLGLLSSRLSSPETEWPELCKLGKTQRGHFYAKRIKETESSYLGSNGR